MDDIKEKIEDACFDGWIIGYEEGFLNGVIKGVNESIDCIENEYSVYDDKIFHIIQMLEKLKYELNKRSE